MLTSIEKYYRGTGEDQNFIVKDKWNPDEYYELAVSILKELGVYSTFIERLRNSGLVDSYSLLTYQEIFLGKCETSNHIIKKEFYNELINRAFNWGDSDEGHRFWSDINDKYRNIMESLRYNEEVFKNGDYKFKNEPRPTLYDTGTGVLDTISFASGGGRITSSDSIHSYTYHDVPPRISNDTSTSLDDLIDQDSRT